MNFTGNVQNKSYDVPFSLQGLECVKKHLVSDSASQEEDLNVSTSNSSSAECSSFPSQSPASRDSSATSRPSPPHAVVRSFENYLQPFKAKKTPLILKRQNRWQEKTAGLLFRKAGAVYHSLACMFNSNGKFGRGLKNCKLAFKCFEASRAFVGEPDIKEGNELVLVQWHCCATNVKLASRFFVETSTRKLLP